MRDDDGQSSAEACLVAVCDKTFGIYSRPAYAEHFALVHPLVPVPLEEARPFPCGAEMLVRDPRETKGGDCALTLEATACCPTGSCG